MYFLTLLDIRSRSENYLIVSDADYVSASNTVSATNLINESVYKEMVKLCSEPVSYYITFIVNCLWAVAVFAALMIVLWLAVRKTEKFILIAFAYVMRLLITLQDIFNRFHVEKGSWISYFVMAVILVTVWAAAIFCRKNFIDSEDAISEKKQAEHVVAILTGMELIMPSTMPSSIISPISSMLWCGVPNILVGWRIWLLQNALLL